MTVVKVDRTCIAILEACEKYPLEHVQQQLNPDYLQDTLCLYSTGFFIESNYQALKELANYALNYHKIFGFNFAAEYIYEANKEKVLEMIEYSDFMFCNRDEAIACRTHLFRELGINMSKVERNNNSEQLSTEEKHMRELSDIALAVARYKKKNTKRPRVMVITDSANPVTVAIGQFGEQKE